MAKLTINQKELGDIMLLALYDAIDDPDIFSETFYRYFDVLNNKKTVLRAHRLDMDANLRAKYQHIRDAVMGIDSKKSIIEILPRKEEKEKKSSLVKTVLKHLV